MPFQTRNRIEIMFGMLKDWTSPWARINGSMSRPDTTGATSIPLRHRAPRNRHVLAPRFMRLEPKASISRSTLIPEMLVSAISARFSHQQSSLTAGASRCAPVPRVPAILSTRCVAVGPVTTKRLPRASSTRSNTSRSGAGPAGSAKTHGGMCSIASRCLQSEAQPREELDAVPRRIRPAANDKA